MKQKIPFLLLFFLISLPKLGWPQQGNIPLHQWRVHFSYQSIYSLAVVSERVYAAGENSLFYYDREENSTTTVSALEGLSDAGIGSLYSLEERDLVLITYRNGNIDIIEEGEVFNLRTIRNASLPGKRSINDVQFVGNFAYLAADYGISVVDLRTKEVSESFFNLGPEGEPVEVQNLAVWNDSLFASTPQGLIGNALIGANLANYNSWFRFSEEAVPFAGEEYKITGSSEGLLAGVDGAGLFVYSGNSWKETSFKTDQSFRSLEPIPGGALLTLNNGIFSYDFATGSTGTISSPLIQSPFQVKQDDAGKLWVADGINGLLSNFEGDFKKYSPNGPLADVPVSLQANEGRVVALFDDLNRKAGGENAVGGFSVFSQGTWTNYSPLNVPEMRGIKKFSDFVYNPHNQRYYFSSLQDGVLEWEPLGNTFRQFTADDENVSLQSTQEGVTPVRTISVDRLGQVWMVQPETNLPLHRYNPADGTWTGYLENNPYAGNATEMVVLQNGIKWLRLKGSAGLLVFNEEDGQSRILNKTTNAGGLTLSEVTAMALDLEGQLWVGLKQGVNYFPNPYSVLGGESVNAAFPVFEGRALLNAEEVTAIAVDGGNRKWIGSREGLWVFGDYGDTLYHYFTSMNSPLPDNLVLDLGIDQQSGEVFVSTQSGIVSFRSGATEAGLQHSASIKVFPNPVYPGFEGKVGITGLARDVIVKITDVSGRLVKELVAEGGTATWDLTDFRGRKPSTGVYLIFSSSANGTETLAGKVAIIN